MIPRDIVVPLDGSVFAERAIAVARKLVAQTGGELTFMRARVDGDPEQEDAYLRDAATKHAPAAVVFVQDLAPAAAIKSMASEHGGRLVCMTSHGRGALRWATLGSVAEDVIRESTEPVVVVGRHCLLDVTPYRTAIVPVDGSDGDDPVVAVAIEWARDLGLAVRLVQVIHPLDVEGAEHPNKVVRAIADRIREAGVPVEAVLLRSSQIGAAIADDAATITGGIVMMSSHGRTGVGRFALGSVAMHTVAMSPVPVLMVHRDPELEGDER